MIELPSGTRHAHVKDQSQSSQSSNPPVDKSVLIDEGQHSPSVARSNNQSRPVIPIPSQAGEEPLTCRARLLKTTSPVPWLVSRPVGRSPLAPYCVRAGSFPRSGGRRQRRERGRGVRGQFGLPGILLSLSENGFPSPAGIQISFPAGIRSPPANLFPGCQSLPR
jgi:hypothetical protein